jgi:uncharacterized protein YecE (DUF72 family)
VAERKKAPARKKFEPPPPEPERYQRALAAAAAAPEPARVERVLFGTAGWTDPTLVKGTAFYPRGVNTPEARLRHYAKHFSMVEVDATYYSLLPAELAARWLSWTPDDFVFDIKAFPLLTGHPIDVTRLPPDLKLALNSAGFERRVYPDKLPQEIEVELRRRFVDFVEPFARAGRLGAILAQYPPWFTATPAGLRELELLRERHPTLPFAVEFRHASWTQPERRERVFELLDQQRFTFVCVDEPGLPWIPHSTSAGLSVVRFHGRNTQTFHKPGVSVLERFDYLYEPAELAAFIEPLQRLAKNSRAVHAVFNNCVRNYAVIGAKDLAVLLQEEESDTASS